MPNDIPQPVRMNYKASSSANNWQLIFIRLHSANPWQLHDIHPQPTRMAKDYKGVMAGVWDKPSNCSAREQVWHSIPWLQFSSWTSLLDAPCATNACKILPVDMSHYIQIASWHVSLHSVKICQMIFLSQWAWIREHLHQPKQLATGIHKIQTIHGNWYFSATEQGWQRITNESWVGCGTNLPIAQPGNTLPEYCIVAILNLNFP